MKYTKEFMLREVVGEYILVPVGNTVKDFHGMISLSPTAKLIWENIEKVDSLDEMVSLITSEYEIDEETAKNDAIYFIAQVMDAGFIETTKEDKSW